MKTNQEKLPGFLEEIRKDNPFKVPHNYFQQFPDQIMEQIRKPVETKQSYRPWEILIFWKKYFAPKPALAWLAMAFLVGMIYLNTPKNSVTLVLDQTITSDEIIEYVQSNIEDFEESDFYYHEIESLDIYGETLQDENVDPLFEEIIDDIDLETIQRIL